MIMSIEQIQDALQDRRLSVVSRATSLHYNTLRAMRDRQQTNPTYDTLKKLSDYLQGQQDGRFN